MKVSEAQKKLCPFIQHAGVVGTDGMKSETLDTNLPANVKCCTNDCMSWIQTKTKIDYDDLSEDEKKQKMAPDDLYKELPEEDKEGYCLKLLV